MKSDSLVVLKRDTCRYNSVRFQFLFLLSYRILYTDNIAFRRHCLLGGQKRVEQLTAALGQAHLLI